VATSEVRWTYLIEKSWVRKAYMMVTDAIARTAARA
jgi:hypothetical protein